MYEAFSILDLGAQILTLVFGMPMSLSAKGWAANHACQAGSAAIVGLSRPQWPEPGACHSVSLLRFQQPHSHMSKSGTPPPARLMPWAPRPPPFRASGSLLEALFGFEKLAQDHSFYLTKDEPRSPHQTLIHEASMILDFDARVLILFFEGVNVPFSKRVDSKPCMARDSAGRSRMSSHRQCALNMVSRFVVSFSTNARPPAPCTNSDVCFGPRRHLRLAGCRPRRSSSLVAQRSSWTTSW
jgi:hypothetical protein